MSNNYEEASMQLGFHQAEPDLVNIELETQWKDTFMKNYK